MKAEPDRLDLLIVVIPFILVGVLGVQVYRYVQTSGEPDPGSQLAREVLANGSASSESPAADVGIGGEIATGDGVAVQDGEPAAASADGVEDVDGVAEGGEATKVEAGNAADAAASTSPGASPSAAGDGDAGAPAPGAAASNVVSSPDSATPSSSSGSAPPSGSAGGAGAPGTGAPATTPAASGLTVGAVPVTSASADEVPTDAADDDGGSDSNLSAGSSGSSGGGADDAVDPSQPATVMAIPLIPQAKMGQVVPVEIHITNANNVGSVPFHLHYNSDVMQLNEAPRSEKGPFLSVPGYDTQFLTAVGPGGNEAIVGLSLMGARSGASGSGVLATLYFSPVAPGTSQFSFTHATVRGPDASIQRATFLPATVTVTE